MRIFLEGDKLMASAWIGWAMSRLRILKKRMAETGKEIRSKTYKINNDIEVVIERVFGQYDIRISVQVGGFLIICYVGDTTGDFSSKRFYTDSGKEIARDEPGNPGTPSGWNLIDDGLYGPSGTPDPVDPWNMTYAYNPGGLGIPHSGSGISPKRQAGKSVRYILDGAIEDETFEAFAWQVVYPALYDYTYNFVRQVDSLTYTPYSIYGPRPFFAKYIGDQIVTMIVPWAGYDATFTWDAYQSVNFRDKIPKVQRIWKVAITGGARTYTEIDDYGDSSDAVIGAVGYMRADTNTESAAMMTRILRAKTQDWYGSKMAEPIRNETYNLTASSLAVGTDYHRCADPANENCYFYDAYTDSGFPNVASTIGNDVRVPHAINSEGKQTYVRIQKSGYFDAVNTGLYCGDALVEESGWESVIKPRLAENDARGPLLIRNTRYRIIHVHSEQGFNAVVYSKTKYVSHEDELIPYKAYLSSVGAYCQVRKTMIRSYTTYHIAVNGVITNLGYSNYRREYRLTVQSTAYSGPPIDSVHSHIVDLPWVDCGYDAVGTLLSEDNSVVMRCDTNSAKGILLIGFDVFPVAYRHDLVYDAHQNLTLEFDGSVIAFPPASDARYINVKDRKWMLFSTNGNKIKDIQPPQKPSAGGHVNRINGLAFIGV